MGYEVWATRCGLIRSKILIVCSPARWAMNPTLPMIAPIMG